MNKMEVTSAYFFVKQTPANGNGGYYEPQKKYAYFLAVTVPVSRIRRGYYSTVLWG